MRILHVTPFYEPFWEYGGMARGAAALCRALARRGHDVSVATVAFPNQGTGAPPEETLNGVKVRRFAGPAWLARRLVPYASGLAGFVRGVLPEIDVLHMHGHRNGLAATAARVLRTAGRPWILQTHGTFPNHGQHPVAKALFDAALGDRIVKGAAALIAVSEAEARDLPRPARVIPNGVEACGSAPRARPRGRSRLLFVGTDRPQKRARVLPALLEALSEVEMRVVGPFGERFRRVLGPFADRVVFTGVLAGDALAAQYADADVVVHPAVGEAFGLVPFEAALAGTPAVVAGGHGCGEWFARAGGCVVAPDDVPALVDAVRGRLGARDVGAAEARAVADFARRELTWDKAAAAAESLYRDVTGGRS